MIGTERNMFHTSKFGRFRRALVGMAFVGVGALTIGANSAPAQAQYYNPYYYGYPYYYNYPYYSAYYPYYYGYGSPSVRGGWGWGWGGGWHGGWGGRGGGWHGGGWHR
jgi:hypothetical protein